MNIALVGYGKMGKAIERIASDRGHRVSFKIDQEAAADIHKVHPENTDVAIEFTGPDAVFGNLQVLLPSGVPVISGSTGWTEKLSEAQDICRENNNAFLWASNFSVGVNLFFELNRQLAKMMQGYRQYIPAVEEIHHTQKLDAPSGTAITLAEGIIAEYAEVKGWKLASEQNENDPSMLSITAIRQDPAPGTHTVLYHSEIDDIEIRHTAHSRQGFALGAVIAAEFIQGKKGIFTMKDVLFG